jgi:hypothetical protein
MKIILSIYWTDNPAETTLSLGFVFATGNIGQNARFIVTIRSKRMVRHLNLAKKSGY